MNPSGHAHSCVGGYFPEKGFHRMVFSGNTFHLIITDQADGCISRVMTINLEGVLKKTAVEQREYLKIREKAHDKFFSVFERTDLCQT